MTSRREFLHAAVLLSAAPLSSRAGVPADVPLELSSVIIDERYAPARVFGTRAQRAGIALRKIKGDITDLWLAELRAQWTSTPTPITGLTARPALFCLEQLAWEYRMRVVYHAEHRLQADRTMLHTVDIAAGGLSAAELTMAGAAWAGYAAGAISRLPAACSTFGPSSACMEGSVGDDEITLHTWVIAA